MRPLASLALAGLAGLGLAASAAAQHNDQVTHRVLGADRGKVSLLAADGTVVWDYPVQGTPHDLARLPGGNILVITGPATVVEVSPDRSVVWRYTAKPKPPYAGPVEVHAFQRLDDGLTMVAETGNRRIVEVDRAGKVVREVPLKVDQPHPHRDTRLARKLPNGHYLVCHEGDGKVREYDDKGKVVWSYTIDLAGRERSPGHGPEGHGTEVFGAIRMPNGHTLIAGGNNNRVIEVDRDGKVVWSIGHDELPGIRLAWVTTLELLENGNVIVGNCHAGPANPQLFEVTREKKVVWTFNNQKVFGNDVAAAQVLGVKGKVVR
jgi:PQQ-like domain